MKNNNILHVCFIDKFIPDFVELVRKEIKTNEHSFITMGSNFKKYPIKKGPDLTYLPGRYFRYIRVIKKMNAADKVMIHGLFDPGVITILFFMPWLLKKCYWVMWGGDIYSPPKKGFFNSILEFFKHYVVKKMGFLVTYIEGDVDYVREKYGAEGESKYCIMYLSNCHKIVESDVKTNSTINIQVGNSADPENDHAYIFDQLKYHSFHKVKLYAPLSYGDQDYAQLVNALGVEYFGDNFIPMYDFMNITEFTKWQSSIDIAIFAHKRQQGMGNTITLLGLGKSVYMRSGVSSIISLRKLGLKIGEVGKDEIEIFSEAEKSHNMLIVEKYFSKKMLISQLTNIFN